MASRAARFRARFSLGTAGHHIVRAVPDPHRPRPVRRVLPLLAVASLAAACGGRAARPPAVAVHRSVVVVGIELPLAGPGAADGAQVLRGAQLAAAQADAAGGVLGRQLQVVARTDGGRMSLARAVAGLLRLHPVAVVGPTDGAASAAAAVLVRRAGVAYVSLAAGGAVPPGAVTATWTDDQLARVEAAEVTEVMRAHRVAVVEDAAAPAAGVVAAMTPLLGQAGVALAAPVPLAPTGDPVTTVRQAVAGRPDAVLLAGAPGEAAALAAAAGAAGMGGRCVVVAAPAAPSPADAGAGTGCVAGGVPPVAALPGGPAFAAAFQDRFHATPGPWAAFGDDALRMLIAALRSAGSADAARVDDALVHSAGVAGVTGDITLDPATGERRVAPLAVLDLGAAGTGGVDPPWASFAAWPPLPAG